ncbi:SH3 domain-containing protein [Bacillus sp. FJAT-49711]|uniref:SH3 domain-containing protein n=1 Tax=Bacillus sp. FJAT-49711 TaxID=2833585 RepID=UPI001BC8D671|nr:SH3 domain-containing protein [Bacillus sp. FJAT-49711]MBS4218975.1 SH3 domain-containing protein [Bacillus sp. FJAT-49711]
MKLVKKLFLLTAILLTCTTLSPFNHMAVEAASKTQSIPKTTLQTTSNLNMRSGTGAKDKIILTIPKGKTVTATAKQGVRYKVSYTYSSKGKKITKAGWVHSDFVKEYYKYTKTSKTYYETNKLANLRPTADTKKKAVSKIAKGNVVYSTQKAVNSIGQTWYRVTVSGKNYYVSSADVKKVASKTFSQTKYFAKNDTNLYSSYSTTSTNLIKIPKGSLVTSKQRIGNWYKINFSGKTGYIAIGSFVKFVSPSEEQVAKETYNVITKSDLKQYAHNSSKTLASIPKGKNVTPTHKTSNGWFKIKYEGKTGYILGTKVKLVKEEEQPAVEPPKVEPPKVEPPKENPPKVDPPKEEPPKEDSPAEKIKEETIPKKTFWVKADLNLRKTADTMYDPILTMPKNIIVIPSHKTSNNWYKVKYNGKTGYVSGSYLQEVKTGDPLNGRTGYQFIDLRTPSPVTAAQINNYIANYEKQSGKKSVLNGKGQVFIDSGKKYGVNALYLAAHAIHESAFGTSSLSFGKYNFFGFGAFDATPYVGAYRFPTINSGIDFIAIEMKSSYLNPANWKFNGYHLGFSAKTLGNVRVDELSEGMNFYYATDEKWGQKIASHMEKILPYKKAYYDKAVANKTVPARPSIPAGSDVFPNEISAIANLSITFHSTKGGNDKVKEVKKGSQFTLLEKTNDYWVKAKIDGKTYWTNNINFVAYKSYITVQNLGRVNVDELNIRPEANTNKKEIGKLKLNDYVSIVLNKDGSVKMDSSKSWYQINLSNGKTGWVSSQYITRELK